MASGLEDLAQDVLSNTRVQASDVQRSLVRLGRSPARSIASSAGGGHDTTRHGRADRGRDGVGVLWDDHRGERRRRHVLLSAALLAIVARGSSGGRWRRQVGTRRCRVGHGCWEGMRRWDKR